MATLRFNKMELLELLKKCKANDELMLVGDQGVYIMSFAQPVENRVIVYAKGCNPKIDADFYENKERLFGGDDGGDKIGTAGELFKIVWNCKNSLVIKLTATSIVTSNDA